MVREQSLSSLTGDLTRFARQNPAVFLGGAALLGFAAARLMKASERSGYGGGRDYDYDYGRDRRFDAPPAGTYNTPYDRTASGRGAGSGSSLGTSPGMAPSSGMGTSSGMGRGTGATTGAGATTGTGTSSASGTSTGMSGERGKGSMG